MRKNITLLLFFLSFSLIAQTETVVTPYGEKVDIDINTITTANNGLTASNPNVQLGGKLIKPTTINTNNGQLQIKNSSQGAIRITDGNQADGKILTSDANGLATWQDKPDPHHSALYYLYQFPKPTVDLAIVNYLVLMNFSPDDYYKVQTSGKYMILVSIDLRKDSTTPNGIQNFYFEARSNTGTILCSNDAYKYTEERFIDYYSAIIDLTEGENISFYCKSNTSPGLKVDIDEGYNTIEIVYLGK